MESVAPNRDVRFFVQWPFGILMASQTILSLLSLVILYFSPFLYEGTSFVRLVLLFILFSSILMNFYHFIGYSRKVYMIGRYPLFIPSTYIVLMYSFGGCILMTISTLIALIGFFDSLRFKYTLTIAYSLLTITCTLLTLACGRIAVLLFRAAPNGQTKGLVNVAIEACSAIIAPPTEELEKFSAIFNDWKQLREQFVNKSKDYPFGYSNISCWKTIPIAGPATSVHQLHPSQIDVIAVLGDSISLAEAAKANSIYDIGSPNPGVNFASGEDVTINEQATLLNIFQEFSKNVLGGSSDEIRQPYDFNFAEVGACSSSLPDQSELLAGELERVLGADNKKFWKFINIFIGHNDFCKICQNQSEINSSGFANSLRTSLSVIRSKIPRAFINLLPPINVYLHSATHQNVPFCKTFHTFVCPCILNLTSSDYDNIKRDYDKAIEQVVREFDDPSNDNFAVVLASAMDIKKVPQIENSPNLAFFALDCFHLSQMSHDIAAKEIWKGLFEPINQKTVFDAKHDHLNEFICPPKNCPFLRTSRNSENCVLSVKTRNGFNGYPADPRPISSTLLIALMFVIGAVAVLLFARATFRNPSESMDHERQRLLPLRHELRDSIF
ncbi:unnamed protein product [Caenorhabditis bovis]|uniref:Uncharacterized protein n=1 Tax=Caenorhabditis bovis TaxID=2654633 RepID=A0A8S1ESE2_9PELO|nr:unnamed protein product [Caenorhabditis bovis]